MAVVLKAAWDNLAVYSKEFWFHGDARTAHLPLVKNPLPMLGIISFYLYFVMSLGPRFMKNRKPFELKYVMIVYNAIQVVCCVYVIKESHQAGWGTSYSWICQPLSWTTTPRDFRAGFTVWCYYILKIVDLLDTVFMVLRKNYRQITFLHLYHHAGIVFMSWIAVKAWPGGHHTFLGHINCIVHCVMYAYYLVCLIDPRTKGAWWKKYITLLQIVQFGMVIIHEAFPLIFLPSCDLNTFIGSGLIIQNIFMFTLFCDFYYKTYMSEKLKGKAKDT